jgi:ribosome-binding factor A
VPTRRQRRINELLHEELSLLVPNRLDDPRLANARVTRVQTTQDLSTAKVYVVSISDEDVDGALAALQHAEGLLRSEIAGSGLRRLPRLVFVEDKAFRSGERVLAILADLNEGEDVDTNVDADVDADVDALSTVDDADDGDDDAPAGPHTAGGSPAGGPMSGSDQADGSPAGGAGPDRR